MNSTAIILASQSPRRRQLLQWAEISFDVIVKETAETYPAGLEVDEIAIHIAKNKALAVKAFLAGSENENKTILAADTIVVLNDEVIGKPKDREDAIAILKKLSGQQHKVITGVVIISPENETDFADITMVAFHELTDEQIAFYVDNYQPYDKAGAYAIQEWIGVVGIKSVAGDFYNVMGLPVSRVVQALKNF
ncbi:MAG: septum formation protein Maf [Chitinophagaceae bacterium]|nr:septum formation protein Maf [Chitinophagaceae bacterium]